MKYPSFIPNEMIYIVCMIKSYLVVCVDKREEQLSAAVGNICHEIIRL